MRRANFFSKSASLDQRGDARLGLERGPVHDQPRRHRHDHVGLDQPVAGEGLAGRDQVDDTHAEPERRRQLHRAVELDALGLDALPLEPAAGQVRVLGGDPQVAGVAGIVCAHVLGFGHRQSAMADAEVDRRVELGIVELLDHVGADDAGLRRAEGDESGDVEGAHADDLQVRFVRCEAQRAAGPARIGRRVVGI